MSKTLQGHRTKLNKTKKKQTKRHNRRQSVVVGRQQLYCAVQSWSPNNCQTTTEKVQSSARDGTSSATVHSWQTTTGCSTHVPKPLGRQCHRVLNVWWTVPPAWRDLMLSTRRCAPENFSLSVIQLQSIGCHPSRNLIDTDGHFLAELGRICWSAKPVDLSVVRVGMRNQLVALH